MTAKSRLQVKSKTAERFREFSRKNHSNQSETLDLILDFFEKWIFRTMLTPLKTTFLVSVIPADTDPL